MTGPPRTIDAGSPVLVGLGRSREPAPVVALMTEVVRRAGTDSGAPKLLATVDRILVLQGSWSLTDPARSVARQIGCPDARTVLCEIGVSQQEVINHALGAVAAGDTDVAVVVGAEARAWARRGGTEADENQSPPDEILARPPDFVAPIESAAGLVWPVVQQYALIETALGAADGQSDDEHRAAIATLWGRFNEVARRNPEAAFPEPMDPTAIATPGPRNRPLAFPYNRWHASQWTVDQATALLICSAERAGAAGVPFDRWLFPHVALHSSAAVTLTARHHLHEWPAMGVLGHAAEHHLGTPLRELELAEIYSCFPAAVRVQQRELRLDPEATPTLTGGMSFAGGPFNHYVVQSTTTLGERLREEPDQLGLVTTVSGMLSKPGLAVWSASPPRGDALLADMAGQAVSATHLRPVAAGAPVRATTATVVSFTVTYGREGGLEPERTAIVADLPDGVRTAATCEDAETARLALAEGLVGRTVEVKDTTFRL